MSVTLRSVAPDDLDLICHHRTEMFRSAGLAEETLAEMDAPFRVWLQEELSSGSYFGFIATLDGKPVGGVGLMEIEWPPHPLHPHTSRRGLVINLYVEPVCRGQGVAGKLMKTSDEEFRRRGLNYAVLHATDMARPIYEKNGWSLTAEMAKVISQD